MNKFISIIREFYDAIMDLIFVEKNICFICNSYDEDITEDRICIDCLEKLIFIKHNGCTICGKYLGDNMKLRKCKDCLKHPHSFTKAVSPIVYDGIAKKALYEYKYSNKTYMYKMFGSLILHSIINSGFDKVDVIVPVPLYKYKKRLRGFNQSELISKYISNNLSIEIDTKNLQRVKETKVQNELHREDRIKNIKDAFIVKDEKAFINKNILLIDDIYTTGATVNECSRVLLESGAKNVFVVTIATGKDTRINNLKKESWKLM